MFSPYKVYLTWYIIISLQFILFNANEINVKYNNLLQISFVSLDRDVAVVLMWAGTRVHENRPHARLDVGHKLTCLHRVSNLYPLVETRELTDSPQLVYGY